jgi:Rod binding domain-containing protein
MDVISAVTPPQGFDNLDTFRANRSDRAYKAFEAMFLQELLKEMRKTVSGDGMTPKSDAMKQYEEMMDGVLAQTMADSGQLGIAKQLQAEAQRQEAAAALAADRAMARSALEGLKPGTKPADIVSGFGKGV